MAEIRSRVHQLLLALQTPRVRPKQPVGKELAKAPEPLQELRTVVVARLLAEPLHLHVQSVKEHGLERTHIAGGLWVGEHGEEDERAEVQALEGVRELRGEGGGEGLRCSPTHGTRQTRHWRRGPIWGGSVGTRGDGPPPPRRGWRRAHRPTPRL